MKPGEETPQDWQQPAQTPTRAPYQAIAEVPVTTALQPVPVPPQPLPQPSAMPNATIGESAASPTQLAEQSSEEQPVTPDSKLDTLEEVDSSAQEIADPDVDTGDDALLRWHATEYIHHDRTMLWYVILGVVVVAFIALALLVFHSITFAILIPVMLIALVVYVRRPPSVLNYILSRKGLHVNDKLYTYDQFKAFGVVSHDGLHSVVLIPRKRFQVSQTIYFPEEAGESLVDMLASRLPMQEVEPDAIDKLLKKLRI
ncbi:MAG: hypothetical protein WBP12_04685 [Candidatus Saccharimonas sp.]